MAATPAEKKIKRRKCLWNYFKRKSCLQSNNLDKLPEYLRETVDWFIGKTKRKDKESLCSEEPKLYLEEAVLQNALSEIDLRMLIELPTGIDYNEWLASHTIAIFDNINLLYGTVSEYCTPAECPDMVGPGLRTYLWFDEKGKKVRLPAPQYIDYVMTYAQKTIIDESLFPRKYPHEFPGTFQTIVCKILRLLLHVMAHLYHSHFREIVLLNLHCHLNRVFKHFVLLNECFQLVELREMEILHDLISALKILDNSDASTSASIKSDAEPEVKATSSKSSTSSTKASFLDPPIASLPTGNGDNSKEMLSTSISH